MKLNLNFNRIETPKSIASVQMTLKYFWEKKARSFDIVGLY